MQPSSAFSDLDGNVLERSAFGVIAAPVELSDRDRLSCPENQRLLALERSEKPGSIRTTQLSAVNQLSHTLSQSD